MSGETMFTNDKKIPNFTITLYIKYKRNYKEMHTSYTGNFIRDLGS